MASQMSSNSFFNVTGEQSSWLYYSIEITITWKLLIFAFMSRGRCFVVDVSHQKISLYTSRESEMVSILPVNRFTPNAVECTRCWLFKPAGR